MQNPLAFATLTLVAGACIEAMVIMGKKMEINKCHPEPALCLHCWSRVPSLTAKCCFLCGWPVHLDPFHSAELESHLLLFIRLENELFDIFDIFTYIWFIYIYLSISVCLAAKIATSAPDICMRLLDGSIPAWPGQLLCARGFVTQHYGDPGQNDDGTKM